MNQLLSKISSLYQLEVKIEEKVSGGFLSENYILSDGATKYFLKKYRFGCRIEAYQILSRKL